MRPLYEMEIIQIDVTNACANSCSNCTRLIGHHRKPFFMGFDIFCNAVDSLADFPGIVGMIGGEPLLHPDFEKMAHYMARKLPDPKRRGLWSSIPKGNKYGSLIKEVFGTQYFNDHTVNTILHQPVLVAAEEVVKDKEEMWELIDHCWVQNMWSASITPKGAFFCEVAASFDMLFGGPGGWEVGPDWWKRGVDEFDEQKNRACPKCGCAIPLERRPSVDNIDDVSPVNLELLRRIRSPGVAKGRTQLYTGRRVESWSPHSNWYMDEVDDEMEYRKRISDRLDGQLGGGE